MEILLHEILSYPGFPVAIYDLDRNGCQAPPHLLLQEVTNVLSGVATSS